jgi:tyrosyl-tRNA synthetase
MLSFADQATVSDLELQHAANPGARAPHKLLARELTELIHGKTAVDDAVRASEVLFGGGLEGISERTFNDLVGEVPSKELAKAQLDGAGLPLVELLVHAGLCPSKGQARKDIEQGGININNVRETNAARAVTAADLLFEKHLLLRKGKRNYVVVTVG